MALALGLELVGECLFNLLAYSVKWFYSRCVFFVYLEDVDGFFTGFSHGAVRFSFQQLDAERFSHLVFVYGEGLFSNGIVANFSLGDHYFPIPAFCFVRALPMFFSEFLKSYTNLYLVDYLLGLLEKDGFRFTGDL